MKQINIQALLRSVLTPLGLFLVSIFLLLIGIITLVTVPDEPEVLLTKEAYDQLENPSQIPNDVLTKLRTLKDREFLNENEFMKALSEAQIDTSNYDMLQNIGAAAEYTSSLERINSVGMSMQILDTIQQTKETLAELNQAKISISKLLLIQTSHAQLEDGEPGKKSAPKKT